MTALQTLLVAIVAMVSLCLTVAGTYNVGENEHQLRGFRHLGRFRNCYETKKTYDLRSGVYTIYPYKCCPEVGVKVYCDMDTEGGGWTVIQRRTNESSSRENFYRTWMEYALGFGDLKGEFWLGLDVIHALTDQSLNAIRFDLSDYEGNVTYAKYNFFYVHNRKEKYKLQVRGYNGTAGDSFSVHNRMKFSAADYDLDTCACNCAKRSQGAWWYAKCYQSNLNGLPHEDFHASYADGISWSTFRGLNYSLKFTEMKVRPVYGNNF
ncbi:ficolin-1-like [Macrobrachium rosenbergii]|uniref:ficolin-1-like n=1 Tax=Macrobrachium rosenbergii TaxID=79674 RepID=UPI0034D585C7